MASRRLADLRPEMFRIANSHIELCATRGVDLLIYCTLRGIEEQAELWRSGRTQAQVNAGIEALRRYPALQAALRGAKARGPSIVTYALPGFSKHQYGLAYDCVPLSAGKAMWAASAEWGIVLHAATELRLRALKFEVGHFEVPVDVNALVEETYGTTK